MPKIPKRVDFYNDGFTVDGVEFPWYVKDVIETRKKVGMFEIGFTMYVDQLLHCHDSNVPDGAKPKAGRRCRAWD